MAIKTWDSLIDRGHFTNLFMNWNHGAVTLTIIVKKEVFNSNYLMMRGKKFLLLAFYSFWLYPFNNWHVFAVYLIFYFFTVLFKKRYIWY